MRLSGLDPDRISYYSHVETWWYRSDNPEALMKEIKRRKPKAEPHPSNPNCLKIVERGRVYWLIIEEK